MLCGGITGDGVAFNQTGFVSLTKAFALPDTNLQMIGRFNFVSFFKFYN